MDISFLSFVVYIFAAPHLDIYFKNNVVLTIITHVSIQPCLFFLMFFLNWHLDFLSADFTIWLLFFQKKR